MITVILRNQFIIRPVRLNSIIKPFTGYEHVYRLYGLVHEYIPEEREPMLKLLPLDAAKQFVKSFSRRYFPIKDTIYYDAEFWMKQLVESAAADFYGMRDIQYEPTRGIPRAQLLAETICTCPFERVRNDRIAVITEFTKRMGDDAGELLVNLLPSKGCKLRDVNEALADSPYPGLLYWCRWIFGKTGNSWLDKTFGSIDWGHENIERVTREWKAFFLIDKEMKQFDTWLSNSLPARSAEVIKYVSERIKNKPKTLLEVFGYGNNDSDSRDGDETEDENEQERTPFAL